MTSFWHKLQAWIVAVLSSRGKPRGPSDEISRVEKKINALERKAWKLGVVHERIDQLRPHLFAKAKNSVAKNETRAKLSTELEAKLPGSDIQNMDDKQLHQALHALYVVSVTLQLKLNEVEALLANLEQEKISSSSDCKKYEAACLAVELAGGGKSDSDAQGRLDASLARLAEFESRRLVLEPERKRLGWRIEVIEEECALMKARLKELSSS